MRIVEITTKAKPGFVTLFRGDSQGIKTFSLSKADPMALFGQGIYLTDNKRVANDYMAKGAQTGGDIIYKFAGGSKTTKQEAIDHWIYEKAKWMNLDGTLETGIHTWGRNGLEFSNGTKWGNLTNNVAQEEYAKRIELATELWKKLAPTVEVRKQLDGDIVIRKKKHSGQVAVFELPEAIVNNCLNADEEIPEKVVDLLNDILVRVGDRGTARAMMDFIKQYERQGIEDDPDSGSGFLPSFRRVWTSITADSPLHDNQTGIRRGLKDLGYTGIKYLGGISMGGGYKHSAYVFWDENQINKFRVK